MLSAKIVGNMMEWKNPMSTTAATGIIPEPSNATAAQTSDAAAKRDSSLGAAIFFMVAEPAKRPIMNPIWWSNKYHAAVLAGVPGTANCA